MNPLDQPTVSRAQFRRALNIKCYNELGVGLSDIPDVVNIDDHWWKDMIEKEAVTMLESAMSDLRIEFGLQTLNV